VVELFRVRLDEAIHEVERELRQRQRLYSEWVRHKRMSRLTADSHMNRLEAAHGFLLELRTLKGGEHEHNSEGGTVAG
jgi:hypothetical protein